MGSRMRLGRLTWVLSRQVFRAELSRIATIAAYGGMCAPIAKRAMWCDGPLRFVIPP